MIVHSDNPLQMLWPVNLVPFSLYVNKCNREAEVSSYFVVFVLLYSSGSKRERKMGKRKIKHSKCDEYVGS